MAVGYFQLNSTQVIISWVKRGPEQSAWLCGMWRIDRFIDRGASWRQCSYGINAFDTARYYGPSEYVLGNILQALKEEFPRSSYQIVRLLFRRHMGHLLNEELQDDKVRPVCCEWLWLQPNKDSSMRPKEPWTTSDRLFRCGISSWRGICGYVNFTKAWG